MKGTYSVNDWIKEKLIGNYLNVDLVKLMFNQFKEATGSTCSLASYHRRVREVYQELYEGELDLTDTEEDLIKLSAQKQKLQDKNNFERKISRERFRQYNTLEEIFTEYVKTLQEVDLNKFKIKLNSSKKRKNAIFHLSDVHFNELITPDEFMDNKFDFTIASKRLKKFVTEAKALYKFYGVTDVLIANTGDMINSSRRMGEILNRSGSLVKASLLATYLLEQVIVELAKDFNITVASVVGNESRIGEFMDSTETLVSENWDYLIHHNLKTVLKGTPVVFIEGDFREKIVTVGDSFNVLLLHGDAIKGQNLQKAIQPMLSKYTMKGIKINLVLFGHIHSASISDMFARSGSLCGGNPYSEKDLSYTSRASQNIYVLDDTGGFNGIKIDLQNVDDIKGYEIISQLETYNIHEVANHEVRIRNLV